jgi:hypothetical protein
MEIHEPQGNKGEYEVSIKERRLEDLRRLNKLERRDEKPFEVVAEVSELGERVYKLFARPFIQPWVNETTAELVRQFHPLRAQRWAISDVNPLLWPLPALASSVKTIRRAAPPENPVRRCEQAASELITAGLNLYRDLRDAGMEALFFQLFGSAAVLRAAPLSSSDVRPAARDPRQLPQVRKALAAIGTGGYPEAVALIGALLGKAAGHIPVSRLELVDQLIRGDEVLAELPTNVVRQLRAQQAVVAELEPEQGLQSLPALVTDPTDRRRLLQVLDQAVAAVEPNSEQQAIIERVRKTLSVEPTSPGQAVRDEAAREAVGAT